MASGSPSQSDLPTRRLAYAAVKANVTSARRARGTTRQPADASRKLNVARLPHCPGDTHTPSVRESRATLAKFAGVDTCLPLHRRRNLLEIASAAASTASASSFVRSSRQSDSAEISALQGSNRVSPAAQPHAYCVASAVATISSTRDAGWPKSRPTSPYP